MTQNPIEILQTLLSTVEMIYRDVQALIQVTHSRHRELEERIKKLEQSR
jgi:hypothetical protein